MFLIFEKRMIASLYKTTFYFIKTIVIVCGLLPEYPYGTILKWGQNIWYLWTKIELVRYTYIYNIVKFIIVFLIFEKRMIASLYKTTVKFIKTIVIVCGLILGTLYVTKLEYPLWN